MTKILFTGQTQGRSMQPMINEGDKLFIEKTKPSDLRIGDIVVFYSGKNFIGHRVVKRKNNLIVTKGDNNPYFDKSQNFKDILGKVARIEGKYGQINLVSETARISAFYFLSYSLVTYYIPFWLRLFLIKVLRGRKVLVKILSLTASSHNTPHKMAKRSEKRRI